MRDPAEIRDALDAENFFIKSAMQAGLSPTAILVGDVATMALEWMLGLDTEKARQFADAVASSKKYRDTHLVTRN